MSLTRGEAYGVLELPVGKGKVCNRYRLLSILLFADSAD